MSLVPPLADQLVPDCVQRLEGAARARYAEALNLLSDSRFLAAVYLFGYSVEMCLCAAFFRSSGFRPFDPIDREMRQRRMAQARQLKLMNSDPHPLVGWARFLEWMKDTTDKHMYNRSRRGPR